ncbi:unnamed protein product [Prunus armeniaca]
MHRSSFHLPLVPNGRHARVKFFTHLSCRTAGTYGSSFHLPIVPNGRRAWSSFHSPLVSNGRRARVEFSLTSRAERQARMGRVFTYPSCRTAGMHGSSFHSPFVSNGRHARVEFSLTPRAEQQVRMVEFSLTSSCRFPSNLQINLLSRGLGGLHDHHRLSPAYKRQTLVPGILTLFAQVLKSVSPGSECRSSGTSKSPTKKFLLDRKLGGLLFVPYLTAHSRRDTWNTLKAEISSTGLYRMFVRQAVPIQGVDYAPSFPSLTFGMVCRATNHHVNPTLTDRLKTPARTCQSTCRSPKTLPRVPHRN